MLGLCSYWKLLYIANKLTIMIDIASIEWGNDSAEKDPNLLKYFIDQPSLNRLYKRTKTFIIGRKGAGKSAIRRKLVEEFNNWEDNYIVEISPTFNIFSNLISDNEIQLHFNEEVFFQYVWLNHIYKKAFIEIGKKPKNTSAAEFKFAIDLAKANEVKEKNLLESAKDLLSRLKVKAGNLGDLGIEIENELRKEAEIDVYEHHLQALTKAGYKITWIIDDLDLGWNNSKIANNLLLGLLTCTNYIKNISDNLHIFVCLREDVYRILLTHTQHSDKYRDIEKIQWTVEGLMSLLTSRIEYNYAIQGKPIPENVLYTVFPETIGANNTANWLFERTLGRPRELLQLVRLYSEKNNTNEANSDLLKNIELEYSNWKLEDLTTEYSNQYPNLFELFKLWRTKFFRQKYHLKKEEFDNMFLEFSTSLDISSPWYMKSINDLNPRPILDVLYEIGFIGDFILGGAGGSKTIYSFEDLHEPIFEEFQIHPCFRKSLGTVERIRSRS